MNQILFNTEPEKQNSNLDQKEKKKTKILFGSLFVLSISVLCFFLSYFSIDSYHANQGEKMAKQMASRMDLSSIYSPSTAVKTSSEEHFSLDSITSDSSKTASVIGTISIPKIDLHYIIFSDTTDELLKVAPCRFYGPMPNEIGNLCIAGHNYDNKKFFSKIHTLVQGDEIIIRDLNNQSVSYFVYDSLEVSETDYSPISQDTSNIREVTLITCNNKNKNRIIIKAKE